MPIQCERGDDAIATVIISNPARRNCLDLEMFRALAQLWPQLEHDARVRCVILGGDGDKAFCSGADLGAHLDRLPEIDDLIEQGLLKTRHFHKPLVAAIQGSCVAGGLELALAADIRICADDAVLGLPEVRWGIMPSGGGAMKLCDQIGQAKAMDLLLTGRLINGREADAIGLVSQACPSAQVWAVARARAQAIAANSPSAVIAAKRAALQSRAGGYAQREPIERSLVALLRANGDPEEGKSAFLEKRQPAYGPAPDALLRAGAGPQQE